MAKIGTAHVEIKPVLNEDALKELTARIEAEVRKAVEAGFTDFGRPGFGVYTRTYRSPDSADVTRNCPCRPENGGSGVCGCTLGGPTVTC